MQGIEINQQFEQVLNFVNQTAQNVFLTGKAGTGKTTLLKYIRQHCFKQMAVVAPTGVAAINAGGSTIHSFFQFPFAPFLPALNEAGELDSFRNNLPVLKYNTQRLSIFRNLELLIIDEVSMVRADLLDQIDAALRHTRRKQHLPFGGVQVLLIGDMYQLPPVVQPAEWDLLGAVYRSPFFFDSFAMRGSPPVYIELEKIYRQTEQTFISLLNKVRNNLLDAETLTLLNSRYKASLSQKDYEHHITLTTHNRKADEINKRNLEALAGKETVYESVTDGMFPDRNYPADEKLVLKEGARVMFLRNNTEKNYFNGKIGVVTRLTENAIHVKCDGDKTEIQLVRETWNNIAYTVNKASKHIEEEVLGTFTQFPLQLAWAITIHKSQGLTFDSLIVDAAESFSAGQVYVALSRCRSLNGLILSSALNAGLLYSDKNVMNFAQAKQPGEQVERVFRSSSAVYAYNILCGLFDFSDLIQLRRELGGLLQMHKNRLNEAGIGWLETIFAKTEQMDDVGKKFVRQMNSILSGSLDLENTSLKERITKASLYFEEELRLAMKLFDPCDLVTESKQAAEDLTPLLQEFSDMLFSKRELIMVCQTGFDLNKLAKKKLALKYPELKLSIYASARTIKTPLNVTHPALYRNLLLLRDRICNEEQVPVYLVAPNKTLAELVEYLPESTEQLLQISGFGPARVEAYGEVFLKAIRQYMSEHGLSSNIAAKSGRKSKQSKNKAKSTQKESSSGDTAKQSSSEKTFELYRKGMSIDQIAASRGYGKTTIESHLVPFVASGDINLNDLVDTAKQQLIRTALDGFKKENGLAAVKAKLSSDISFSEIKYVQAALAREERL